MLPSRGRCLRRIVASPVLLTPIHRPPLITALESIRHGTQVRKRKKKSGEFVEKEADKRLRLKRKFEKELDKKRQKIEKIKAARLSLFKLPPHKPRPDAVPFGTAMQILRGWGAKSEIFVRCKAARWAGETEVVAMVRVVPNDHNPRGIKGKVQFPHPVVLRKRDGTKKERIAVILEGEEGSSEARKAGMIVGGKEYLDKIVQMVSNGEALPFDVLLATPKSVLLFRQHGRILGPKGLMPNEKRGTIVEDFGSYGIREEKGIELKLDSDGKSKRGGILKVVVGKFKQDDHDIEANLRALIVTIHKITGRTQIPLELSLYTTIHPSIVKQNPYLTIQNTIHVPRLSASGTLKLQRRNTVYPPDRAGYRSNASFIVPIADFQGVGHPKHLRPNTFVKRFVADAEWSAAEGQALQLSRYKAGIRDLEKKKFVYKWSINRTEKDKLEEWKLGLRRSGEHVDKEKLVL